MHLGTKAPRPCIQPYSSVVHAPACCTPRLHTHKHIYTPCTPLNPPPPPPSPPTCIRRMTCCFSSSLTRSVLFSRILSAKATCRGTKGRIHRGMANVAEHRSPASTGITMTSQWHRLRGRTLRLESRGQSVSHAGAARRALAGMPCIHPCSTQPRRLLGGQPFLACWMDSLTTPSGFSSSRCSRMCLESTTAGGRGSRVLSDSCSVRWGVTRSAGGSDPAGRGMSEASSAVAIRSSWLHRHQVRPTARSH